MDLDPLVKNSIGTIVERTVSGDGFAQRLCGELRADATAWSILALSGCAVRGGILESACRWLASIQLVDGRVPVNKNCPNAYWPTPLAILAWKKASGFDNAVERAKDFLLATSGLHFSRKDDSPAGHNTELKGWSWIENTHSWIEPTSTAILALKLIGAADHHRVQEAVRMILDRQLPSGGWNYGNTTVFSRELLPMPEHTGQALCALSGYVEVAQIQKSIDYARDQLPKLFTPFSLCWCMFGLSSWNVDLQNVLERVLRCLSLQERLGGYDTALLAQLVLAYISNANLLGFLNK
jgi:hypothetical protein